MVDGLLSDPYDIVVVGAGPAGSSAASAAARKGARVLLIDRRKRIGVPVQCAELVSRWVFRYVPSSSDSVVQTTETMITHISEGGSDGKRYEMKSPGYMLDRSLFDKELASSAVSAGAKLSTETRLIGLSSGGVWVEKGSQKEDIRAEVIIGADGVHSLVSRHVGLSSMKTVVALQYEVVNPHPQDGAEVFFHPDFEGGYAWFFPKGKTANVGLGIVPEKTALLSSLLDGFLERLAELKGLPGIEILAKTGGSVPCEGPRSTVFNNILLAGDAAGHAHPITGAGILNAVVGGEIAGRIAAEAVLGGNLNHLRNYETEWHAAFGKALSYGALKRQFLQENWNNPRLDFATLIRKTWVGFKEYYEDRKKEGIV
jgi:digeranylgeranylglycerophospholipid reductase